MDKIKTIWQYGDGWQFKKVVSQKMEPLNAVYSNEAQQQLNGLDCYWFEVFF